jgi:predicted Ser/Thr protein kinase
MRPLRARSDLAAIGAAMRMTTSLSRTACLDPEAFDLVLRGRLSRASRDAVEIHLAACAECRIVLSTLAKLHAGRQDSPAPAPPEPAAGNASTDPPPPGGARVSRYTVLDCLGAGGMGVVYCAHDPELARKVALKVLRTDLADSDRGDVQERLRREAQAMAQMAHPNVVTVYDVGTWEARVFIAMELVEGQNLSQWLGQARRSWTDVVAVFLPAGRGLMAAHAAGIVHRDFKPANVLLGKDGRVLVGDFGLAAIATVPVAASAPYDHAERAAPAPSRSQTGSLAGTPYYMAPEQIRGEPASARSDQFSFCVALHEALAGERRFARGPSEQLLAAAPAGRSRLPPLSSSVPRWLQRIVHRGLSVEPDDRYPSMAALVESLARGPSRRWLAVSACAAVACTVIAILIVRAEWTGASERATGEPASGRPAGASPYDASLFANSPDVRKAFDREWLAMHTDACESPRARCILQATNLLRDAGFDQPGRAWQASSQRSGVSLSWIDGYVRISTREHQGSIGQDVPWIIAPGQSYSFTVWVRVPAGHVPARGQLSLHGYGRGSAAGSTTEFLAGADWRMISVTVTSKVHHRGLYAELSLDAPGSIDIDNAELTDAGLVDPSFEDAGQAYRAAAWTPYNDFNAVHVNSIVTDAFDGLRALEVRTTKEGGSIAQDTAQSPLISTTYTFTAWLRAAPGASPVEGTLALWALGKRQKAAMTSFAVTSDWSRVQASVSIEAHGYTGLRAEIYVNTVDVPLQIDGTRLTPAGLMNASFEDDSPGWFSPDRAGSAIQDHHAESSASGDHRALWKVSRDHAVDGGACLRMIARYDDDSIAQDLGRPLSGTTYTFTAWVRVPPGEPAPVAGHLAIRGLAGTPEEARTAFQATRQWTLVTTTLAVRRDDHVGLRVEIAVAESGSQIDLDGTRVTGADLVLPLAP